MLQESVSSLIHDGIEQGQRMAISADLWRYAQSGPGCHVLLSMTSNREEAQIAVICLVESIRSFDPSLTVEVRYHKLKDCYSLYISADYKTLLKGAELCRLRKPVGVSFGGGCRPFCFDDAHLFVGLESRESFLSTLERARIIRQILSMVRAPIGGLRLEFPDRTIEIPEGREIVGTLLSLGIISNMHPLHDREVLSDLRKEWMLSADTQPIEKIKDYFGTEIAMYFAWLGHMTRALRYPAALGVLMFFFGGSVQDRRDDDGQFFSDLCFVLFALLNCVWSTVYLEQWKRKQAELAFQWGTYSAPPSYLLDPRPAFKGDRICPNPVTGRGEPFYPQWKQMLVRYGISYPLTALCVFVLCMAMFVTFATQQLFDYYFGSRLLLHILCYIPMVCFSLFTQLSEKLYRSVALRLNDLENYRTEDEYENHLITKIVFFQFASAFGTLFYIAFYEKNMKKLQETLATLLITRQISQNFSETAVPFFLERLKLSRLTYKMTRSVSDTSLRRYAGLARERRESEKTQTPLSSEGTRRRFPLGSPRSPRLPIPEYDVSDEKSFEISQAELESLMPSYDRPLDDYLEMFIQFGYVLLFSPAFPLAAASALLNNFVEIRVDAFKLCKTFQRPFGREVRNIGEWERAMEGIGMLGVIVNCALIGQSGLVQRAWPDMSWGGQILLVVALEHLILGLKVAIDMAIPDVPEWIDIENARREYFRQEQFKGNENRIAKTSPRKISATKRRSITPMRPFIDRRQSIIDRYE